MTEKKKKLTMNSSISVNSVNGQKQLILNNTGLALMPLWAVKTELKNGSLVQVMKEHIFSPYEELSATNAIYLKREMIAPKIRVFLDFIAGKIKY